MTIFDLIGRDQDLAALARSRPLEHIRDLRPLRRSQFTEHRATHFHGDAAHDGFAVTRVAEVRFQPDTHIWDDGSYSFRIAVVVAGAGWFITDHLRRRVDAGCFFTRLPREPYELLTEHAGLEIIVVNCDGHQALHLHGRFLGRRSACCGPEDGDTRERFHQLLDDATGGSDESRAMAGLHCELILRSLAHLRPSTDANDHRARASFRRCRSFIDERAKVLRGCGEVARACGVDPSYMGRLFKRYEGISPKDYLARVKMGHARELLTTSDLSVQEIAEDLAYNDPFTFSRSFKRVVGCSPSAYRAG